MTAKLSGNDIRTKFHVPVCYITCMELMMEFYWIYFISWFTQFLPCFWSATLRCHRYMTLFSVSIDFDRIVIYESASFTTKILNFKIVTTKVYKLPEQPSYVVAQLSCKCIFRHSIVLWWRKTRTGRRMPKTKLVSTMSFVKPELRNSSPSCPIYRRAWETMKGLDTRISKPYR